MLDYLDSTEKEICTDFLRLAWASVANIAIVPMQDLLELGNEARMNLPGTTINNWMWRAKSRDFSTELAQKLAHLTTLYGRTHKGKITPKTLPMKKTFILIFLYFITSWSSFSQEITLTRVEPPFWWAGFKNPELQLLVYGKNIGKTDPSVYSPGIELKRVHVMENPDYLSWISSSPKMRSPVLFLFPFTRMGKKVTEYLFELRGREEGSAARKSFDASDVIYLVMPDRFSNGDPANDNLPGFLEKTDRSNPDGRHGGDIKGIQNHLDYIKDLGATAIWINPLLENNMVKYSYHGYSTTDYYKTDPRFGSNNDYLTLSYYIHQKGMKLIMDMVFNHCGSQHWWMADPPTKDWFNQFPEFTRTSYRAATASDPYISASDYKQFVKGWFDVTMPDLNQTNPFVAKYLIQNSIWWIEYAGLDGIRQDTYPYCDKKFMAEWDKAVITEYPNFNIVGECWLTSPGGISYWQKDAAEPGRVQFIPSQRIRLRHVRCTASRFHGEGRVEHRHPAAV